MKRKRPTIARYRAEIRRLSYNIPRRDKRKRRLRHAKIRYRISSIRFRQSVFAVVRSEHVSFSEGRKIVLGTRPPKPVKRLQLHQGQFFVRETYARRGNSGVLKGAYYTLGSKPSAWPQNFSNALVMERGRIRPADAPPPAGELAGYVLRGKYRRTGGDGEFWYTSQVFSIDTPFRSSSVGVMENIGQLTSGVNSDELELIVSPNMLAQTTIAQMDVQFIYSG